MAEEKKHHGADESKKSPHIESISSKVASAVDEELPEFEDIDDEGTFMDTVRQIMRASGLRGRHALGCLVVFSLAGLAIGFFTLGGFENIRELSFFKPSVPKEVVTLPAREFPKSDLQLAYRYGFYSAAYATLAPSLELSYAFGKKLSLLYTPLSSFHTGLATAFSSGFRGYTYQRMELYTQTIRQVQSALNTDVNNFLNQNKNRRGALDALIADFDKLYLVTQEHADLVLREVLTLQGSVAPLRDLRTLKEKDFSVNISAFLPREASKSLQEFITVSKDEVEVKAHLGAFQKLDKYFQTALVKLASRIKDIKANYEPLVKGVKVFDIKNSDIDIIKYEGGAPRDTLPTPFDRTTPSVRTPLNLGEGM